ncbi:MAG TPA: extracellular solute-binding protein [Ktedonobacteraceae bacterium]
MDENLQDARGKKQQAKGGINWGHTDKAVWDWILLVSQALGAIAIPFVILVVGLYFTEQNTQQQAQLSERQHQTDLQIAAGQQQETTLKAYLDDMSNLLLNNTLLESQPGAEIRQVAKEQTLTTLRRLDADHNRILLRFLRDAHLIGIQNAVINLSNADLSKDDLRRTDLSDTDLIGADLSGADLSGADLSGAFLYGADLSGAHLSGVDLSEATLSGAHLSGVDLSGVDLSDAILNGANLSEADLSKAILYSAYLNGSTLSKAILNGTRLNGAHLNGVDLSEATLSGADLSEADLSEAGNLTQPQLDTVSSCTNAILSTGLKCNHSSSMVNLTYWYTEGTAETPVIQRLIKQFEQQNHNIQINAVQQPFFQTQAAFITAAQAGNAPDVLRADVSWVPQFASQHYLLNIDSYISANDLSDYLPAPLSYDKYNGHFYGLPQVTDFLALLYNKAELSNAGITSPPATMADFEAAAIKMVQSKAPQYGFETTGTAYYMLPFLWAFGGGMFDKYNNILVNNAGSVAGLNFLLKLQNTDQVMPAKVDFSNGYINMVKDFMSGKTAMIFDGPYEVSNILKNGSAFKGNPSNLGIVGIPMDRSGNQPRSPRGGQSYVIYAHTAHPAEAYKFISFMSSTASQVAIARANHTLPTRQSAYQDPVVSGDPVISAFYSIQHTAMTRPAIPQGGHLFDAFDPNILAALDGAKSTTDALEAVADAWKQLLGCPTGVNCFF